VYFLLVVYNFDTHDIINRLSVFANLCIFLDVFYVCMVRSCGSQLLLNEYMMVIMMMMMMPDKCPCFFTVK